MLTAVGNATTGSSIPDADRGARQSEKLQSRNTIERPCPKPTGGGSSAIAVVAEPDERGPSAAELYLCRRLLEYVNDPRVSHLGLQGSCVACRREAHPPTPVID